MTVARFFSFTRLGLCAAMPNGPVHTRRHLCTHPTAPCRQSWADQPLRPWMCTQESCRAINRPTASVCAECGHTKPSLRGWKCVPCGSRNFSGVKTCRQCAAPESASAGFWMCIVCERHNRIDEVEDNSRCGHCGYDMAPHSVEAEARLQRARERAEQLQHRQEEFDSMSASEAEAQWGIALPDLHRLPPELRRSSAPRSADLPTEPIAPYDVSQSVQQQPWRHLSASHRESWGNGGRPRRRGLGDIGTSPSATSTRTMHPNATTPSTSGTPAARAHTLVTMSGGRGVACAASFRPHLPDRQGLTGCVVCRPAATSTPAMRSAAKSVRHG